MMRWVVGGAVVLMLVVAALVVPMRDGGTETVAVTEVAADEGVCGKITSAGDLIIERTVPLIDLGFVMQVDAAVADPLFEIAATESCADVDALSGGVVLGLPGCESPSHMTADEAEEFTTARFEPGASLVELCDGAAMAMIALSPEDGSLEMAATWGGPPHELGRELVIDEPNWCLRSEYWLDVHTSSNGAAAVYAEDIEPVVATWCVDLAAS